MRVTVVRAGGLAGMVTTTSVDTADLAAEDAARLAEYVKVSGLLDEPPPGRPAPSAPQPDREQQEIVVEDGERRASLRVAEQDTPEPVRELVRFVRTVPGAQQTIGPPGPA